MFYFPQKKRRNFIQVTNCNYLPCVTSILVIRGPEVKWDSHLTSETRKKRCRVEERSVVVFDERTIVGEKYSRAQHRTVSRLHGSKG